MMGGRRGIAFVLLWALVAARLFASSTRTEANRVFVNEVQVLTVHSDDSDVARHRAVAIANRLRKLDAESQLSLKVTQNRAVIMFGDDPLVTITGDEARSQGQSPEDLATSWLQNIRKALALPAVQLEKPAVKMSIGAHVRVNVIGSGVQHSLLENSDQDVADVYRQGSLIVVLAKKVGQADVTVRSGDSSQTLEVNVLPYAAQLPQTVDVEVTGDPSTAETVQGAVMGAIRTQLHAAPGAELDFTMPRMDGLAVEGSSKVNVAVKITAPDAYPAEGNVTIQVHNTPLSPRKESELWYCNDPESVRRPMPLFAADLQQGAPARLLYHHINESGYPLVVAVRAMNESDRDAKVVIIPGDSTPDKNPVLAGFQAGDQFLRNWIYNSGEIITIPAHTEVPISIRRLSPLQTMSGLCYLRLLGDGPQSILVRTDALSIETIDARYTLAFNSSAPWRVLGPGPIRRGSQDIERSPDVYPDPFKTEDLIYKVGGRFGFARLGQKPLSSYNRREKLDGNFGVIYILNTQVINTTSDSAEVEIVFEASAGYSGAVFVVNGNIQRTSLLQPKEEALITRFKVEPGETHTLRILTCPLSGGSYPATITVRPIGGK
jgi:hypothetical protein